MAYARSDERLPRSGGTALAACALMQAVLGVEFLLGGINKLVTPNYVSHFRDFVATSVGSQTGILAPIVHGLVLPHFAIAAQLARFTELTAGLVLVLAAAEVARRRLGGRLGLRRSYEPAVALLGAAAALTVGGLSLTIYMLQGGALPRVNPALAFGPPIAIELFNVPVALGIAWLEFGRFVALRDRSMTGSERTGFRRVLGLIFAGLLLTMGLVACGGGGGSADGQPAGSTKVTMTDFRFSPNTIDVKAGQAKFFLVNSGSQQHDMVVTDSSGKVVGRSETVQPGNDAVLSLGNLPAGTYDVVCDLPGHKENGMVTKLNIG